MQPNVDNNASQGSTSTSTASVDADVVEKNIKKMNEIVTGKKVPGSSAADDFSHRLHDDKAKDNIEKTVCSGAGTAVRESVRTGAESSTRIINLWD